MGVVDTFGHTSVYLNLFHRPMGKIMVIIIWIVGTFEHGLLDLISLAEINISKSRFGSYDPWDMAN